MEDRQSLSHIPVSHKVSDEAAFLWGDPDMFSDGVTSNIFFVHFYFFILIVRAVFEVCPLNVRVGENSPSL